MSIVVWERARADVGFLASRRGSVSELRRSAGARAWGMARKHVRNDAGTRTSESVMCKFMGQPVVDIRIHRSRGLLHFGVPWLGCRTRLLTVTWPSYLGGSRA
jgi:hypothetical protein